MEMNRIVAYLYTILLISFSKNLYTYICLFISKVWVKLAKVDLKSLPGREEGLLGWVGGYLQLEDHVEHAIWTVGFQ